MHDTSGSLIKLALYVNLTTEGVVTPIEEAKILFKEMLSLPGKSFKQKILTRIYSVF